MKTIVITGPSGSGKSFLTNKLIKLLDNTIVIKTDSYYRDGILIKLLSKFKNDIYDRNISIKSKEIMNTLDSIYKKKRIVSNYSYDFKTRKSAKTKLNLDYNTNNRFLILEGIFAHRLDLNYKEAINIECMEEKDICFKRRLRRDTIDRGRNKNEVKKRFFQSWDLYFKNIKQFKNTNKVITIYPSKMILDKKLINIINNNSLK